MEPIKNKNICIIGLGKEGVSVVNFLGGKNKITIIDQKPKEEIDQGFFKRLKFKDINFYFGGSFPSERFDYLVRSPGVPLGNPIIEKFTKNGAILTSATKIFFDLCHGKVIGVTGTKGKGTTSTLIYEILKTQNKNVFIAGNIGTPMLDILPDLNRESLVVLELSSFQLADLKKSPHIAVVLMITSEHLDWHKDTREYTEAKTAIVRFQTKNDFALINQDFEASRSFGELTKAKVIPISTEKETSGVFVKGTKIISHILGPEEIIDTRDVLLPGKHNFQNVVAAIAAGKILGVPTENIRKVLKSFKGLEHRLQLVRELRGIKFYNDSFSTTPETTIAAIEAFTSPKKILILGGSSKNSDFNALGAKIANDKTIKAIVVIGEETERILGAISTAGGFLGKIKKGLLNMSSIVRNAFDLASSGDVVILSPACASFDMFKNYQDRGEQFIKEVRNLK